MVNKIEKIDFNNLIIEISYHSKVHNIRSFYCSSYFIVRITSSPCL